MVTSGVIRDPCTILHFTRFELSGFTVLSKGNNVIFNKHCYVSVYDKNNCKKKAG